MTREKPARSSNSKPVLINDPADQAGTLKAIGGSPSDNWNSLLANQAVSALWTANSNDEERNQQFRATAAAMVGIGPKDELEGMMAAQLIAAHNATMECHRRAMHREQSFEARREALNQANKLSRTWTTLLEALNRHRGKGQQKVTVEHVHVHAGGQAVVGAVEASHGRRTGGGVRGKSKEQRHAKPIAHAPEPALWCPDAERDAVPVPGDG